MGLSEMTFDQIHIPELMQREMSRSDIGVLVFSLIIKIIHFVYFSIFQDGAIFEDQTFIALV